MIRPRKRQLLPVSTSFRPTGFKIYRREYKKRFGWIRAGKLTADACYQWSEQARAQKLACDKGEFEAWLRRA